MTTRRRSDRVGENTAVRAGVAVIGLGNWGTSLVASLRAARVPVLEVVHASVEAQGRALGPEAVHLETARLHARMLWLAVPDAAIAPVAERLAHRRNWGLRDQVVLHSSGVHSSAALHAAVDAGAAVASVHPLMSFPTRQPVALTDVPFAVEATDPHLRRRLFALVRKLGGRPFALSAEGKPLYHAASVFASPLLASLLAVALETMQAAGLGREAATELLYPIARRTVDNVFRNGPERSFSGPLARGDSDTIEMHLQALAAQPLYAQAYRSLALAGLALLPSAHAERVAPLLETDRMRER